MPVPQLSRETESAVVLSIKTKQTSDPAIPHDPVGLHELHSAEGNFRRRLPVLWWTTLLGPFVLSVFLFVAILLYAGPDFALQVVAKSVLTLYILGRFIILSGSDGTLLNIDGSMSSAQLFVLVTYLDVMVALVLAFHIGFLFRIPWVGKRFLSLVTDGHFILDAHPWIRRATFVGLTTFVSFPLTATGSVGGSIFGRLLGMSRVGTFWGIMLGSVAGNGVMYFFSESLALWLDKNHPVFKYGGFVVIAFIAIVLERRYRYLRDQFHLQSQQELQVVSGAESPDLEADKQ
jgi:uncharacterized membrane protein